MVFDPFNRFTPQDFVFKIARTPGEIEGFWALRQAIFCEEQNVFHGSDRDEFDTVAIPIVCETLIAGMEDTVVGVVRIDEREPNVWFGSRLGVASDFRSVKKISPRRGIEKPSADLSRAWRVRSRPDLQGRIDCPCARLPGISGHGAISKRQILSTAALGTALRTGAFRFAACQDAG
jgi:hypothetical protein